MRNLFSSMRRWTKRGANWLIELILVLLCAVCALILSPILLPCCLIGLLFEWFDSRFPERTLL